MQDLKLCRSFKIGICIVVFFSMGRGSICLDAPPTGLYGANAIGTASAQLVQDKNLHGTAIYPNITLNTNLFDPTAVMELENNPDPYYALATSNSTEELRGYLEETYNISEKEVIAIVSAVFRHSDKHSVAPELILSIIANESSFKNRAKSSAGALGLMQVLPVWHQDKIRLNGGSDALLWNPEFNIGIGTHILRDYINLSNGDLSKALARYNGSLGKHNGYSEKVLRKKTHYKQYTKEIKTLQNT